MKLTIFSRLVIGYLVIFILAMTVSIYAISHLRQFEKVTRSIINVDNRLIEYKKKLSDILLSMMLYEKKYIFIKDDALYNQFDLSKNDFDSQLTELTSLAEDEKVRNLIDRISRHKQRYQSLFYDEVKYMGSGQQYDEDNYKKEKELAVNEIMEALKELEAYSQGNTYSKVRELSKVYSRASKVAVVIGSASLIFGIMISILITVNITRPLSIIKKKTVDIAKGDFGHDLKLTSPPEIEVLAKSFNLMCSKLKEIDKLKSDFFSLMSHELRTPLTTIKEGTNLFSESLEELGATAKQKKLMSIINEECNRLIKLVNSLLDLSKMEAGMMVYNFQKAELAPLISKITGEIEPLAENRNIRIETEISKELPFISMDTERILQVLRNLVGNAVKFTPNGGFVRISAQFSGKEAKISVADSGTGISEDKVNAIFDKYYQDTLSRSSKIKGTGLGLAIVKQVVNSHGGKVWVESTSEHGSIFSFVLPV
ncbi:MAG: HAMP domain-containing histidine kinase [Nitrospirae bacterium]|nr:HAMP domain-containing histidine kinase [Nitrospirota bacterium]